jgi:hypothetical protein|tara:strand:- start:268 stop:414 length:147 start_codon:yes stop_codon:yes gene_type:complete
MNMYDVVLSDSGVVNILAKDKETAAYNALELSLNREESLIDVRLSDEW